MKGQPLIGRLVKTLRKTLPSSTGNVVAVSDCGRYAVVEKRHGKKIWKERWAIKALGFYKATDNGQLTTGAPEAL